MQKKLDQQIICLPANKTQTVFLSGLLWGIFPKLADPGLRQYLTHAQIYLSLSLSCCHYLWGFSVWL